MRDDWASAELYQLTSESFLLTNTLSCELNVPTDIGVLDDLTITSAASDMGTALLRPLGGVDRLEAPAVGAENIL